MKPDYLIIGSGLSALVFAALMAKAGKKVQIIEAHEFMSTSTAIAKKRDIERQADSSR